MRRFIAILFLSLSACGTDAAVCDCHIGTDLQGSEITSCEVIDYGSTEQACSCMTESGLPYEGDLCS
jgi:hypothetical protein